MNTKEYRKALIEEANEHGLDFKSNIPSAKLQVLVDKAQGASTGVSASDVDIPEVKIEVEVKREPADEYAGMTSHQIDHQKSRKKIQIAKKKAMETKVVTITNRDTRDAEFTTTAPLSFENNYFSLAKDAPLDMPIELEVSLIGIAESATMVIHKDEVIDGKRTGNKTPQLVKKYAISYGEK